MGWEPEASHMASVVCDGMGAQGSAHGICSLEEDMGAGALI